MVTQQDLKGFCCLIESNELDIYQMNPDNYRGEDKAHHLVGFLILLVSSSRDWDQET